MGGNWLGFLREQGIAKTKDVSIASCFIAKLLRIFANFALTVNYPSLNAGAWGEVSELA